MCQDLDFLPLMTDSEVWLFVGKHLKKSCYPHFVNRLRKSRLLEAWMLFLLVENELIVPLLMFE